MNCRWETLTRRVAREFSPKSARLIHILEIAKRIVGVGPYARYPHYPLALRRLSGSLKDPDAERRPMMGGGLARRLTNDGDLCPHCRGTGRAPEEATWQE